MFKSYKYQIYPTKNQAILLDKHFGCCRFIYNWALEQKSKAYAKDQIRLSAFDLMQQLIKLKQEFSWLKEPSISALQQSIFDLDTAFVNFFKKLGKYPKFKSKHKSKQSYRVCQHFSLENFKLKIPKVGKLKIKLEGNKHQGELRQLTISKSKSNKYFVSLMFKIEGQDKKPKKIHKKTSIGIDLGIKHFLTTSSGEKIDNPKFYQLFEKRIIKKQKIHSRRKKDSKRKEKARIQLALLWEKLANKKQDFLHKLTYKLTHENQVDTICVEDLGIKDMLESKKLAGNKSLHKNISDCSWGVFLEQLADKCRWYGKNLIKINRFDPSSKICSKCGVVKKELALDEREWKCEACNFVHDRDVNAAKNILSLGLVKAKETKQEIEVKSKKTNTLGRREINARGELVRSCCSSKREPSKEEKSGRPNEIFHIL